MTTPGPLVSVVTPVYDGEAYLAECMESVLAQEYRNWEYVVLDNASADRTAEIAAGFAERDGRVRVVRNDETLPQFDNWNASFRLVSPDARYVKVVHADDLLFPDCLGRMVASAERHPGAAVVAGYSLYGSRVKLDGFVPYPTESMPGTEVARQVLLGGPNVFGSPTALLLRADAVRAPGRFYDGRLIQADVGACLRLLLDHDFAFVHQVLTYTRVHSGSVTSATAGLEKGRLGRLELIRTFGPQFLTEDEMQQALDRQSRRYYYFLARAIGRRKGRRFWEFHRRKLDEIGRPLQRGRLLGLWLLYALPWRAARGAYRSARAVVRGIAAITRRRAVGSRGAGRTAA